MADLLRPNHPWPEGLFELYSSGKRQARKVKLVGGTPGHLVADMAPISSSRYAPRRQGRARRFLSKKIALAKRKTEPILHRGRWRKSRQRSVTGKDAVAAGDLIAQLKTDLRMEREQIFEPLLRRMRGIGRHLAGGENIPPKLIEEGLLLWERYLKELHDPHINQIRLAGPRKVASQPNSAGFSDLVGDVSRARVRIQTMRWSWSSYRGNPSRYRTLLALVIAEEAQAGLAWQRFEEEYANAHLPTHFSPSVVPQWTETFAQIHKAVPLLRERVREFRARTNAFAL